MTTFLEEFRRVSRREACPVCDTWDHGCLIHNRTGQVACAKVETARPLRTAPPTWLHGEDEHDWRESGFSQMESPQPEPPPDPVLLDRGLRALLTACPLTDGHRHHLRGRCLSDDDIAALPLGSITDENRPHAAQAIASMLGDRAYGNVPGLWRRNGRPALAGSPGLLIGAMEHDRLVGVQIRPDTPTSGKYVWLSSRHKPDGCASGAPATALLGEGSRCVLIEGTLKGLIVRRWAGLPVVAVPGVGIVGDVVDLLNRLGDVETVLTAVDADRATNPAVAAGEAAMVRTVRAAGYRVERLTWSGGFKGLDDALAHHAMTFTEPLGPPTPAKNGSHYSQTPTLGNVGNHFRSSRRPQPPRFEVVGGRVVPR